MTFNKDGDLLKSDCTVIMHQANCFKTMGGGIAKAIASLYPEAYNVDRNHPGDPMDRYGTFTSVTADNGVTIVNLYGQYDFGGHLKNDNEQLEKNYKKLEEAIDKFFVHAKAKQSNEHNKINLSKVGIPFKMGSDLAGGDWNVIRDIVERQSNKHEIDIYIYKL